MKTEAVLQLAQLVRIPTVTQDIAANDQALDYLEQYFAARGLHCVRDRFDGHGTLVATTRAARKTPKIMLAAHVDVMAGSDKLFTLRRQGTKLTGRGTLDMKSAIAAYMQVVDDLQATLDEYDLGIMITSDEELGSVGGVNGTKRLLEAGYRPQMCVLPDGAGDWQIESLAKGHWRFDVIATGQTAHSSRPWEGDSASFKLIHALHDIRQLFLDHGPLTNTLNIGIIKGGEARNQIPALMTAAVEIRIISDESFIEDQKRITDICNHHGLSIETHSLMPPIVADTKHPLIQEFMASVTSITGLPAAERISYAGSDAVYLAKVGIPYIVTYPPGGGHHSETEWIDHQSFLQFAPILRNYLEKVAKIPAKQVDREAALV